LTKGGKWYDLHKKSWVDCYIFTNNNSFHTILRLPTNIQTIQSTITQLTDNLTNSLGSLQQTQIELDNVKHELQDANKKLQLYKDTLGIDISSDNKTPIEGANLKSNTTAKNPTWQQLMDFIKEDTSDCASYNFVKYKCVSYAESVYNSAYQRGIRAAFVTITFRYQKEGHALNAFLTTNKGLVYIDCTGKYYASEEKISSIFPMFHLPWEQTKENESETFGEANSYDKVAYVKVGEQCGLISLDFAASPKYDYFEEYKQRLDSFKQELADWNNKVGSFNEEVRSYNNEIRFKVYIEGTSEYQRIIDWYNKLSTESKEINQLWKA
jgi:hypothetical protein